MRALGFVVLILGAAAYLFPGAFIPGEPPAHELWPFRHFVLLQACLVAGISHRREPYANAAAMVTAILAVSLLTVVLVGPSNMSLPIMLLAFGLEGIALWILQRRERVPA